MRDGHRLMITACPSAWWSGGGLWQPTGPALPAR